MDKGKNSTVVSRDVYLVAKTRKKPGQVIAAVVRMVLAFGEL